MMIVYRNEGIDKLFFRSREVLRKNQNFSDWKILRHELYSLDFEKDWFDSAIKIVSKYIKEIQIEG